jgi:hypothetical protein
VGVVLRGRDLHGQQRAGGLIATDALRRSGATVALAGLVCPEHRNQAARLGLRTHLKGELLLERGVRTDGPTMVDAGPHLVVRLRPPSSCALSVSEAWLGLDRARADGRG